MVRYIFSIGQYFSWVHAQHGRFIEKQSSHVVQGHKLTNCLSGTSTDTQTWESTGLSALLKLSMHLPAQMQEASLFNVVGEKTLLEVAPVGLMATLHGFFSNLISALKFNP